MEKDLVVGMTPAEEEADMVDMWDSGPEDGNADCCVHHGDEGVDGLQQLQ